MHSLLIATFCVGVLTQLFALLSHTTKRRDWLMIAFIYLVASVVVFLVFLFEEWSAYTINWHILGTTVFGTVAFSYVFAEQLVAHIGARSIALLGPLVTAYTYQATNGYVPLVLVLSLTVLLTLMAGIARWDERPTARFALYGWHLALSFAVTAAYFDMQNLFALFEGTPTTTTLSGAFVLGLVCTYLVVQGTFLCRIAPIRRRHQSRLAYKRERNKYKALLSSRYVHERNDHWTLLSLTVVTSAILLLQAQTNWIDLHWLIAAALVVLPFMYTKQRKT